MKKVLTIGIPAVLVVAGLAGPKMTGSVMENNLDRAFERAAESGLLTFRKKSFEQGYFHSEGEWEVGPGPALQGAMSAAGKDSERLLSFKATIENGPLLLDDGLAFGIGRVKFEPIFDAKQQAELEKYIEGGKVPLELELRYGLSGSAQWHIGWDAFEIKPRKWGKPQPIQIKPAQFEATIGADYKHTTTVGSWDGWSLKEGSQQIDFGSIKIDTEGHRIGDFEHLWLNVGDVVFDGLTLQERGKEVFAMGPIKIHGDGEPVENNKRLNISSEVTVDYVKQTQDIVFKDGVFKLSMKGLDAASLDRLAGVVREAYKNGASSKAAQTALGLQLMGILPEMVSKGFTLSIDELSAEVMGNPVHFTMTAEIQQGANIMAGVAALHKVTAVADCSVPRKLLMMLPGYNPEMIDAVIQQGFVKEENGVLKTHAEFKELTLTLNGKPVPLPGLSGS